MSHTQMISRWLHHIPTNIALSVRVSQKIKAVLHLGDKWECHCHTVHATVAPVTGIVTLSVTLVLDIAVIAL